MSIPKIIYLFSLVLMCAANLSAQTAKPMTTSEIATYMGPDREQLLYAGAKAEGGVTWYTFLAGDSYKALARAFETQYPGLRVEAFRSGGNELVARMFEEAKARRPTFDGLETTYDFMMVSRANNLTRPYNSPLLAAYPSEAKEKADKGLTFWTIFRESYMGFGYNKNQVSPDAVPKGFDGLLHPQLKGKMAITLNESSARMIGAMIKIKGEAFVKKLKAQDIQVYTVSSAALVDLMASASSAHHCTSIAIMRWFRPNAVRRSAGRRWSWCRPIQAVSLSPPSPPIRTRQPCSIISCLVPRRAKSSINSNTAIRRTICHFSAGIPASAVPSTVRTR